MELMAFDTKLEMKERLWTDQYVLKTQLLIDLKDPCSFLIVDIFSVSVINFVNSSVPSTFLWTSGVPCSSGDAGKCASVTWCSTKSVTKLKYNLTPSKKKEENCLALDTITKKLINVDCSKKGIVFCEV